MTANGWDRHNPDHINQAITAATRRHQADAPDHQLHRMVEDELRGQLAFVARWHGEPECRLASGQVPFHHLLQRVDISVMIGRRPDPDIHYTG
jgi:hypothetical protein